MIVGLSGPDAIALVSIISCGTIFEEHANAYLRYWGNPAHAREATAGTVGPVMSVTHESSRLIMSTEAG